MPRPPTHAWVNLVLGVVAATLVAVLVYQETIGSTEATPATTTTGSTSTGSTTTGSTTTMSTNAAGSETTTVTSVPAAAATTATTAPPPTTRARGATTSTSATARQPTGDRTGARRTTTTAATTTTTAPPPPREFLPTLVVNGSSQGQRLAGLVEELTELGYPQVRGVSGAVLTPDTTVYVERQALLGAGRRLARDLDLGRPEVTLLAEAPPIAGRGDALMVVYLGGS